MGRVTVDIKEWVANGRFEGEQKLHNREGKISITASLVSYSLILFSSYLLFFLSFCSFIYSSLIFSFALLFHLSFSLYLPSSLHFPSLLSLRLLTSLVFLLYFFSTKGNHQQQCKYYYQYSS